MEQAERLDLLLWHSLVGLDIKVTREICPHRKVCKPGADTAIPVEQQVRPFTEVNHPPQLHPYLRRKQLLATPP
jgi:hypothetical protein